ncbi:hypothetical protein L1266_17645 [Pseudoalteromonas sp. Cn5-37]|uniref:hypothetical protein n=1 Tax=Pseudoalteromonas sp. Cn5-37 TaxID=2908886 RepID=UPI001F3BFEE7|nr:hypothetical protein [Pseudoalteromonas sp. Cn5-37]MCF2918002.1 hypothetical protein [Pseudoalteromonas sp. Cn5-37]
MGSKPIVNNTSQKKIRIVFNSRMDEKQGSVRISQHGIKSEFDRFDDFEVFKNIFSRYDEFDVAILHGDEDEIKVAREQNKNIIIGVVKPHLERTVHTLFHQFNLKSLLYQLRMFRSDEKSRLMSARYQKISLADFVIADTIHLKNLFESRGIMSIYLKLLESPIKIDKSDNLNSNRKEVVFGYHGNERHFLESTEYIFPALNLLSHDYDVKLKVVSNIGLIKKIPKHTFKLEMYEYSFPGIYNILSDIDIGLVPNQITLKYSFLKTLFIRFGAYFWNTDRTVDLLFRYKQSVNAGRAFIFSQLNKPFIACPVPEVVSIFGPEMEDYFPYTHETWEYAIIKLAKSKKEQLRIKEYLYNKNETDLSISIEALKLRKFIKQLLVKKKGVDISKNSVPSHD